MEDKIKENVKRHHVVLLLIVLSSTATGIYRDGFAALFPFLQSEFGLSRGQLGLHSTFLFFANMIGGVYGGRLIDLKGSKAGLVVCVLALGIVIILHAGVPSYFILLVLASFSGFILSINPPAANKAISEWFPSPKWGSAMGIQSAGVPLGGVLAATLLPALGVMFGWRMAIIVPGAFALLCAILIYRFYPDCNNITSNLNNNRNKNYSFWGALFKLFKNIDVMVVSILGFFLGAASGTVAAHFTLFLYLDYGLTEEMAGIGFGIVQLGSLIGRPGWGIICNKYIGSNKKMTFLLIGIIFAGISVIYAFFLTPNNISLLMLFLLAFFVGFSSRGWHGLFFSSITETVEKDNIGIAMGFSLFFVCGGIMIFPPIFGLIADFRGTYDFSWLFLGGVVLLAVALYYGYYIFKRVVVN